MNASIRRAVPADAPELVALASAVASEEEGWLVADSRWRSAGDERRYIRALQRHPDGALFVATLETGELVGRLSLMRDPHPASRHVADLGLMVAARYRRRGVGTALMAAAEQWAREGGVRKLRAARLSPQRGGDRALREDRLRARGAAPRTLRACRRAASRRDPDGQAAVGCRDDDRHAVLLRPEVEALAPYQPGKPIEEVQRELGLPRVVKLASNEGPWPPFPAALAAMADAERELNRYPDGGCVRLQEALAARHGVAFEEVCAGSGADGCLDLLSQAVLGPGDEVVCGWPSFPSYPIYAAKQGAATVKVPLTEHRYDLDALLGAISPRTKIVYVCHPNNPTGTMNTREELDSFLERTPAGVLTVVDQAYFEYVGRPDYPDAIREYFLAGRRVLVLRTFSKLYGLAGLRVGYAVGPLDVCAAMAKVRRPFDLSTTAQEAARASLDDPDEVDRRRLLNRQGLDELTAILRRHGLRSRLTGRSGTSSTSISASTWRPSSSDCSTRA